MPSSLTCVQLQKVHQGLDARQAGQIVILYAQLDKHASFRKCGSNTEYWYCNRRSHEKERRLVLYLYEVCDAGERLEGRDLVAPQKELLKPVDRVCGRVMWTNGVDKDERLNDIKGLYQLERCGLKSTISFRQRSNHSHSLTYSPPPPHTHLVSPLSPSMADSLLSSRQSSSSIVQPSRPSIWDIWLSAKLAFLSDRRPVRFWSRRMCRRSNASSVTEARSRTSDGEVDEVSWVGRERPVAGSGVTLEID